MAFFLLPLDRHTRENLDSRAGSFLIAIQAFSTRICRMNPDPMPVIRPFRSVWPVECSLQPNPTKPAIFFPLPKRERSSPSSNIRRMAVNHPMPGMLFATS